MIAGFRSGESGGRSRLSYSRFRFRDLIGFGVIGVPSSLSVFEAGIIPSDLMGPDWGISWSGFGFLGVCFAVLGDVFLGEVFVCLFAAKGSRSTPEVGTPILVS